MENDEDWRGRFVKTHVGKGVTIGSNVTVMGDLTIGNGAMIGAGSVVTKDVPANQIWAGNPARYLKDREDAD
jgi:acetyltransferase-like isoleucine patch superfamily enzyme